VHNEKTFKYLPARIEVDTIARSNVLVVNHVRRHLFDSPQERFLRSLIIHRYNLTMVIQNSIIVFLLLLLS
jgi:hypothetical protein